MEKEKTEGQKLQEKLLIDRKNGALRLTDEQIKKAEQFAKGYEHFLNVAKTEREVTKEAIRLAKENGFVEYEYGKKYRSGDRIYFNNRDKAVILTVMGKEPIESGIRLTAAHIDSPRLDLKAHPLYEDMELALFKTRYYGGIKKYQWTTIPLSLHGVVVKQNGEKVDVNLGEDEGDPIFCVTDLLIHLAQEQMKRTLADGVKGEELNVLVGSYPFRDDEVSERVKLNIIRLLNEKYGIVEQDFLNAELEMVPAFKARDLGFDRSMVGAYGQDDRVCAYPALMAALETKDPANTLVCVLTDKEETGSDGNTGLNSAYLFDFIADLAKPFGVDGRRVLSRSKCLSADVNAASDPTFADVTEKNNACYLNYGVAVMKYSGGRGKGGTSDASAEYIGAVQNLLTQSGVLWQNGELGKVDQGGGGTVAQYIANRNVDVVDVGVPVLSMHSPFEVTAKIDLWSAHEAFYVFGMADSAKL